MKKVGLIFIEDVRHLPLGYAPSLPDTEPIPGRGYDGRGLLQLKSTKKRLAQGAKRFFKSIKF